MSIIYTLILILLYLYFYRRISINISYLSLPTVSIIEHVPDETLQSCLVRCLKNYRCGIFSYDQTNKDCYLRIPYYWRSDAIESKLTTVSILLSCLLKNHATTRETFCQNNNPLFEMLSKSATHQQTSLWNS